MIESPWLHLTFLIISSICFAISCFDVIPCSPAILIGCLAFTLATAFYYWIHASQTCAGSDGQPKSSSSVDPKTPSDANKEAALQKNPSDANKEAAHQKTPSDANREAALQKTPSDANKEAALREGTQKPNWFERLWDKIKDWMSDDQPETEGIIIVKQDPKIKYLVYNSELGFTPDTVEEDESPFDAAQRSVTEKTALKPKDLKIVPNFSKEAAIESTDPEGKPETKNVTFLLAEISPETKVPKGSEWLTPEEALERFPEMKPVITASNQKLTDPEDDYDLLSKITGVNDAPLQKWFMDPHDDVIWRVVDRNQKIIAVGEHSSNKKNPCYKPIVITAIISVISTLIVVGAVMALLHFFPDIFTQIWGGIVQAVTSVLDAIKKLFGK